MTNICEDVHLAIYADINLHRNYRNLKCVVQRLKKLSMHVGISNKCLVNCRKWKIYIHFICKTSTKAVGYINVTLLRALRCHYSNSLKVHVKTRLRQNNFGIFFEFWAFPPGADFFFLRWKTMCKMADYISRFCNNANSFEFLMRGVSRRLSKHDWGKISFEISLNFRRFRPG